MSQSIAIVDYGMGNVRSVQKALEHVAPNDKIFLTDNADLINDADRLVFPGQGAIGACMQKLNERQLVDVIKQAADKKPFLGICLGLQLLFDHSQENGGVQGLSILAGEIVHFPKNELHSQGASFVVTEKTPTNSTLKIPHMGWNKVKQTQQHPLWHDIEDNARFYSVHSYYVKQDDESVVAGSSDYGIDFTCAVAKDNLFAVQFHPEKSQHDGLQLLKNFVNWDI
ncbi:Imidazole glycerol phosphate synthase amidotransferase subunit HisH [uncultured Gammaproteobacteria bacterium]|jgi:glutamine amidotransferase|uniref:Imidazole glycerol phosphate synthase subunit HisH n=3 Tax=sulfur-oxidizing symbionts TaxID=32036 RepID=A0A1H6L3Z9_9GAMM|nr:MULTISPECIES: imidazole glycerol phosphate synthase subunit HisH [sulfur-oxidizing symbionts]CAC9425937.1 Imidazole glycerol phosphate synthase amidotransferase subunit HisH [uncultured Gammaproteobacteria bacterium]CAB5506778.1 Imidazole glycerol phosphate synthase amidotransferase subunit HisH [Bathymodiolus azoricus thioautotrophic gill symbiont]CAB5508112.1 Imidazole glycerol phosphate synthase amidotransferase subunit HisH [Bathymodiolus thermophilus thioautotrophic gill symbiont]CAC942